MEVEGFVRAFVAILAISNVLPLLPLVVDFTSELEPRAARRYGIEAILGGYGVAALFLFGAPAFLAALSLGMADLQLAGGIILLVYATHDLLFSRAHRAPTNGSGDPGELGPPIAPLGVPIMVGPGTLSLVIVLAEVHGRLEVSAALAVNAVINVALIAGAPRVLRVMGAGLGKAVTKVMSLILAAIGAGMLRAAIVATLAAV